MKLRRPQFPHETPEQTAAQAIRAYWDNPATTYTPRNIIDDFGEEIVAALEATKSRG